MQTFLSPRAGNHAGHPGAKDIAYWAPGGSSCSWLCVPKTLRAGLQGLLQDPKDASSYEKERLKERFEGVSQLGAKSQVLPGETGERRSPKLRDPTATLGGASGGPLWERAHCHFSSPPTSQFPTLAPGLTDLRIWTLALGWGGGPALELRALRAVPGNAPPASGRDERSERTGGRRAQWEWAPAWLCPALRRPSALRGRATNG